MNSKKYCFIFVGVVSILMLVNYLFVSLADPNRVFNAPWMLHTATSYNFYLEKLHLMAKAKDTEVIVLGSSTSENYLNKDVESLFQQKSFHASVAASQAIGRMALANYALENLPQLKSIIYVADFYEFNQSFPEFIDPLVADNKTLAAYIPKVALGWEEWDIEQSFWQIYSQSVTEKSIEQVKKAMTGKDPSIYAANGDKVDSVSAPVTPMDPAIVQQLASEAQTAQPDAWLDSKISESVLEYINGALQEFEYATRAEALFYDLTKKVAEKNINLYIIPSMYHPRFSEEIFVNKDLAAGHKRWMEFLISLGRLPNVHVLDTTPAAKWIPNVKPYWRDGVHYSQVPSSLLLFKLLEVSK